MKTKLKIITISVFLVLILTTACGPKQLGRIEKRGSCEKTYGPWRVDESIRGQYLVNKSKSKIITFTLKLTEISSDNDEVKTESETDTYKLNPGEETELLCEKYFYAENKEKWTIYKYEIVGAVIEKD